MPVPVKSEPEPSDEEKDWKPLDTDRSVVSRISHLSRVSQHAARSSVGMKQGPTIPSTKKPLGSTRWEPPPWRGSDPKPTDTLRLDPTFLTP